MSTHHVSPLSVVESLRDDLSAWTPVHGAQDALRHEYIDFISTHGDGSVRRANGPEHLTASCFVFDAGLSNVLLCFHKKGQFWVQLGGHIEANDPSVAAAAFREALEEGGIADLVAAVQTPLDVDRHGLGDGFGSCSVHWDLGYVAIAPTDAAPSVSDESEAVAWWPVDALPGNVPPGFGRRLAGVLAELRAQGGR